MGLAEKVIEEGASSSFDRGFRNDFALVANEPLHEQVYRQIRDELASATFNNNSPCLP